MCVRVIINISKSNCYVHDRNFVMYTLYTLQYFTGESFAIFAHFRECSTREKKKMFQQNLRKVNYTRNITKCWLLKVKFGKKYLH